MNQNLYKLIGALFLVLILAVPFYFYISIFSNSTSEEQINFEVKKGESVSELSIRLEEQGVIKNANLFSKYVAFKKLDRQVQAGNFVVDPPVTIANVAKSLKQRAEQEERSITIIPGWGLHDIAAYFAKENIAKEKETYSLLGEPAKKPTIPKIKALSNLDFKVLKDKPVGISYEGYLAPDTYRIFTNATYQEILEKLIKERDKQFTEEMYADIKKSGRSVHEILTMASIVEREVRGKRDKAKVADLFWRRYDSGWGLQADSTVHYIAGNKDGDFFTTSKERDIDSEWNTYKYAGLPPGPISNPSLESIMATVYPEPNEFWYFLTTFDGVVKYGRNLDEHNANVQRYLR